VLRLRACTEKMKKNLDLCVMSACARGKHRFFSYVTKRRTVHSVAHGEKFKFACFVGVCAR
jgi:hypothetical protein